MFKNQLQELAQRSCFNLPSYHCIREGPDHAPRFKSVVDFNGETFESPKFYATLRQAEHSAAQVALSSLSDSHSLSSKILDESGVCKNLVQEMAQRAAVPLPVYTTTRSGPGHLPFFTCKVEVAGMEFSGESAKSKKQAEKNAAMVAWSSLKKLGIQEASTSHASKSDGDVETEHDLIANFLAAKYKEQKNASISYGKEQQNTTIAQKSNCQDKAMKPAPLNSEGRVAVEFSRNGYRCPSLIATHYGDPTFGRMFYSPYHLLEGQNSVASCGQLLDYSPPSTLICSDSRHLIPFQVGTVPLVSQRVQETLFSADEHQRDEEKWIEHTGSALPIRSQPLGSNICIRTPTGNAIYSYGSWPHSAQWINIHPTCPGIAGPVQFCAPASLAPPVRVRPAVPVYMAPPRPARDVYSGNNYNEKEAETQVLNDMNFLKLE